MTTKTTAPAQRTAQRWHSRCAFLAGAAAVALAGAACTSAPSPPSSTGTTTTAAAGTTAIGWSACGTGLDCAKVPVPLDWKNPNGTKIELAVIRHRASRPAERIGSIFINPGGPGDTGVGMVRDSGPGLDAWGGGRFDIISWDPRGTHASSPIHCFADDAEEAVFWKGVTIPYTASESAAYATRMLDLARRCGQVMGDVLSHVSTADTARDLDALRQGVGEEKFTYVGLSYGTYLGLTYVNMFPQHVRAMMLDSVVDPVPYTTNAEVRAANDASSVDEVVGQFVKLCDAAGPTACKLAGHPGQTAAQRVDALFDRLRQGTIPAPHSDPPGQLVYNDLVMTSFAAMRDPGLWPAWAEKLNAAADGDASALETEARLSLAPKAFAEATKSSAISCLDAGADRPVAEWPTVIGELAKGSRWAGAIEGWWLWAPCAANWPATSNDRYTGPWNAKTDVPVLVINGRYDPNTSYANAVAVSKMLGNAVLLTLNGYGHVTTHDLSACVEKARVAYLVDLVTPPPGTVCEPDKKPFTG